MYQSTDKPKKSYRQPRNPHELLQDPFCLRTAGKTQNNCFGNDRGSSSLDFIFPKVIYSLHIYDFLSGHVVQSRVITGPPGKIKTRMRCHCQQSSLSSLQMGFEELSGKILKLGKKIISWTNQVAKSTLKCHSFAINIHQNPFPQYFSLISVWSL